MKTALITGVSGYLGSHLAKALKLNGWNVVGFDRRYTTNPYVDLLDIGDVTQQHSIDKIFQKVKIDTVFHLAGRIEVCESTKFPIEFYHQNVTGTINVLNSMKRHGVQTIIYSSTAGLYKSKDDPIKENDEVNPLNNPYAGSKYAAEIAIRQSDLNYVIFRYFNLAGADPDGEFGEDHEPETHLIPRMLQNLNNFQLYGKDYPTPDGTCIRDYVHVCDVADAHILAAKYAETHYGGDTINLGTGQGHSVFEILELLVKHTDAEVQWSVSPRRIGDPPKLVADITYAKNTLKFNPKHDIISILKTAHKWQNRK